MLKVNAKLSLKFIPQSEKPCENNSTFSGSIFLVPISNVCVLKSVRQIVLEKKKIIYELFKRMEQAQLKPVLPHLCFNYFLSYSMDPS
jgi:hypothetical protein